MIKKGIFLTSLAICIILSSCNITKEPTELLSPDGKLSFRLFLNKKTGISYQVFILEEGRWQTAIESSPLGITRKDADFTKSLKLEFETDKKPVSEEYKMVIGNSSTLKYNANEKIFSLKNKEGKKLDLVCRAFNEGVAFRYVFPGKDTTGFEVTGELTSFNIPDDAKAWIQPYDTVCWWAPAYEQFFENGIESGTTAPANKNGWCFPLLFETGGRWIYISEAGLDPSYCGSHLMAEAPGSMYSIRFPEEQEADDFFPRNPVSKLPWTMPWRYILVGRDIETIFNSNHVYHLSEASRQTETTWIKPGTASWSWWSEGSSPRDFKSLCEFVDFASEMGWEYSLVDAGWHEMEGGKLKDLVDYARKKNVGILLWYDSGGRTGYVKEEQSKIMFNSLSREREMQKISGLGVRGIKVDFFQSDKQGMIKLYYDILQDAARYKLLVNFHGCTMPRGWTRTFPHLLTMEAVRGGEAYRFDEKYTSMAPVHNTILPFTRNVAGPMDYTPLTLSDNTYPHTTSFAHELALSVVFQSGIQHFADHYSKYRELPPLALQFMKEIPSAWDQSKLLAGFPGKEVVAARRTGRNWFIGGINGEDTEKELNLSLAFLPPGSFEMIIVRDGLKREDLVCERRVVTREDSLQVKMNPRGGFCARTGTVRPLD